jgi:hypothetical protein
LCLWFAYGHCRLQAPCQKPLVYYRGDFLGGSTAYA